MLVDVVVRDKRGDPVRDLTQADFELSEDGVPQKIGSFTPVLEGGGLREPRTDPVATPSSAGAAVPGAGAQAYGGGPIVTALVFDRLDPEARKLAIKAAQGYLGTQDRDCRATSGSSAWICPLTALRHLRA